MITPLSVSVPGGYRGVRRGAARTTPSSAPASHRCFAILRDRRRFLRGDVILPQALSWVFRIASVFFFLRAFHVTATVHNALLAQVVESLSTLFPATPGGAGTKQGLIVYLFRGKAISRSLLLAFSVGMNIAIVVANLVPRTGRDLPDGADALVQAAAGRRSGRPQKAAEPA